MKEYYYKNQISSEQIDSIEFLDREDLVKLLKTMVNGGISLMFNGKRSAQDIQRKVKPRVTRVDKDLSYGTPEEQSKNIIIEGENLQAMVTLYKYRGKIDLIVTDPPYNTGKSFRYNDKWDNDPNDPDLGSLVTLEDGSRHTKWAKAMLPRLQMMWAMLKPNGVIAICIDENELFHLGMMLDEVFEEKNRIAIINWQKSYSPKNDSKHVSTATEYVLVYAKDKEQAKTGLLSRSEAMNSKYKNPDNDPKGLWRNDNPTASRMTDKDRYAIQSPFTGALHYPGAGSWRNKKSNIKKWLEGWGTDYVETDIKDGRPKALVIKGAPIPSIPENQNLDNNPVVASDDIFNNAIIAKVRNNAEYIKNNCVWPMLYFGMDGYGRPATKRYLNEVKRGKVPLTYWANDDYDEPIVLGSQSWDYQEAGHSQAGIKELDAIIGKGHGFDTVKPLKLIKKIIHLWCPPNGIVLDPYAGSGTTGHAVLELNKETGSDRRFILIEQGSPENGDKYARSLTRERIRRAITGERPDINGKLVKIAEPLGGGFEFQILENKIDANTVLSMKRDELIDVVVTSHWEDDRRNEINRLERIDKGYEYLVCKNMHGEGCFIIWNGKDTVEQLDAKSYAKVVQEAKKEGLKPPYHVYARYQIYQSKDVKFYKIPDKILAHLGLNEYIDKYNNEEE